MFTIDLSVLLIFCITFLITMMLILRPKSDIPGPTALPIIGNLFLIDKLQTSTSKPKMLASLVQKYGPIFRLFLGPYQVVFVTGYKNVFEVLKGKGHDFEDRPNWLPLIRKSQKIKKGSGILWANGNIWKDNRRFALQSMRDFGVGKTSLEEKILEEAQGIVAEFERANGKDIDNVRDIMTRATCNVIHHLMFGYRYEHHDPKLNKLISSFHDIFKGGNPLSASGLFPAIKMLFNDKVKLQINARKYVAQYIIQQIKEQRQTYDKNHIRSFVDIYIKEENEQTGIKNQHDSGELFCIIADLFAGGTDTTASTLDWSLLYMIGFPDVQQKCQEQIAKVVGFDRMVRTADRAQLPYVEATLMEVQRLANTAAGTVAHMATCDTTIGGYKVPKGTIVSAILTLAHMDEAIWDDPTQFDPTRFLDGDNTIIRKELLMPFSGGPRTCPGHSLARTEMFLIFSNLLQRFTFSKVKSSDALSFEGITGITRVASPYRLYAKPRDL